MAVKPRVAVEIGHHADRDPTTPAKYERADVVALKALAAGTATPEQQQRGLDWIIKAAADTYGLSFRLGSPDGTAFAEGRRSVGLQVVKLLNINLAVLSDKPREQPS
jgi:hypothetical protein